MAKPLCSECGLKRHALVSTKLLDGTVVWVCKVCWNKLDFPQFGMKGESE